MQFNHKVLLLKYFMFSDVTLLRSRLLNHSKEIYMALVSLSVGITIQVIHDIHNQARIQKIFPGGGGPTLTKIDSV